MRDPASEPAASPRGGWRLLLAAAVVVSGWAVWQASELEINAQVENMLPQTPAAEDYRRFLREFGGVEKIFVLVTAAEGSKAAPDVLTAAADRLASVLRESETIDSVRSGLDSADEALVIEEMIPRALLFANDEQRMAMRRRLEPEAVRARVHSLKSRLILPSSIWEKPLLAADPLGLSEELDWRSVGGQALGVVDPSSGAFLSPDRTVALVIVTPRASEIDTAAGLHLQGLLESAYAVTWDALGPHLAFEALGGPLYAAQDEKILRGDLTSTVTTSAMGVAILLLLYFWSFRTPMALALAVATGVLWTAALMSVLWGRLSVVGLAFGSILVGLGVDYGIHGAVRFHQWRARGLEADAAVRRSISDTAPAIQASAWTTVAAFLVLVAARFMPLRELGLAVALGIVMILAASLAVGASLLATSPTPVRRPPFKASFLAEKIDNAVRRSSNALNGKEGRIVVVAVLLTAAALGGVGKLRTEADLQSFRPIDHPARGTERLLAEKFGVGVDTLTIVLEGPDLDTALDKGRRIASLVRQELGQHAVISSPSDWLLSNRDVRESLGWWTDGALAEAVETMRRAAPDAGLSMKAFERSLEVLERVAAGKTPPEVPATSWPSWLAQTIRVGPEVSSVAIQVRATKGTLASGPALDLQRAIKAVEPGAAIASAALVGEELRGSVLSELRRLGTWCGLAIALGVLLSFRWRWFDSLLALLPVTLGFLWLVGLCGWLGIALDPFSAMMAPLILGIGIDDGLHALHGRIAHGGLREAILAVGPPMVLTTLTTCVGFGSLLVSSIPTLRRGGALVALGTLFCLLATLIVLPAAERLLRRPP